MLKIRETTERSLATPQEIADHLKNLYKSDQTFSKGQAVRILEWPGLSENLAIGSVGVIVYDPSNLDISWVLTITASGVDCVMQIPTNNLRAMA